MVEIMFMMCALVWFAVLGFVEGTVMSTARDYTSNGLDNGVRQHCAFKSCHWFRFGRDALLAISVILFTQTLNWYMLLAVLAWGWQLTEMYYSWSRTGRLTPIYENVLGMGRYFTGHNLMLLQLARVIAGALFIVGALT